MISAVVEPIVFVVGSTSAESPLPVRLALVPRAALHGG